MLRSVIFLMATLVLLSERLPAQGLTQDRISKSLLPLPANTEIEELRFEVEELRSIVDGRFIPTENLLEPPIDPQRLVQAGDSRGAILLPGTNVSLRFDGYARGEMIYDTGFCRVWYVACPQHNRARRFTLRATARSDNNYCESFSLEFRRPGRDRPWHTAWIHRI